MFAGKILIVDDSPIVCEVAETLLQEAGFEVTTRTSAIGLSGMVYATKPAVVVLDIEMPGLTGVEACERIHRASPDTKVLFFSSVRNLEQLAATCGADGWLPKQNGLERLVESVRRLTVGK